MYEYKVASFLPTVTEDDFKEDAGLSKAKAQMEAFLQKHARDGWELQGQYVFDYRIEQSKSGVIGRAFGAALAERAFGPGSGTTIPFTERYNALVFRRQLGST